MNAPAWFPVAQRVLRALGVLSLTLAQWACSSGTESATPNNPSGLLSAGSSCSLRYRLASGPVLTGSDPLLGQQWHLENTGQSGGLVGEDARVRRAWRLSRGTGVRVAIVDDSVELVHEDLWPNVVSDASHSYRPGNPNSGWPLPCDPIEDRHGTAVAGIVAARDSNQRGGAGVAPRAALVAYDAMAFPTDINVADALRRDGQNNAIYQNSWGATDDGRLYAAPTVIKSAIDWGIKQGRGGRGAIYVFPTGNGGCYARTRDTDTCQADNANYDGYVNQLGVITVCAVDDRGKNPWYAEAGANVLLCAPSSGESATGITTTDLENTYRSDFPGTSASAPTVSGVVALMLARNPTLSWRDVRLILAETARRNDPTHPGWQSAARGRSFNHQYGYGVVDADAAVARSETWKTVGDSSSLQTCESSVRTLNRAIPDAIANQAPDPLVDAINLDNCAISQIEFVTLTVNTEHSYAGDLRIELRSPAGTTSEMAQTRQCKPLPNTTNSCGDYRDWTFGSVRHLNENARGNWTLSITDMVPEQTGRLTQWSIRVYGR